MWINLKSLRRDCPRWTEEQGGPISFVDVTTRAIWQEQNEPIRFGRLACHAASDEQNGPIRHVHVIVRGIFEGWDESHRVVHVRLYTWYRRCGTERLSQCVYVVVYTAIRALVNTPEYLINRPCVV